MPQHLLYNPTKQASPVQDAFLFSGLLHYTGWCRTLIFSCCHRQFGLSFPNLGDKEGLATHSLTSGSHQGLEYLSTRVCAHTVCLLIVQEFPLRPKRNLCTPIFLEIQLPVYLLLSHS